MRCKAAIKVDPEIKKLDRQEAEALKELEKQAQKALDVIQENHFHLRLWKAVGGKQ